MDEHRGWSWGQGRWDLFGGGLHPALVNKGDAVAMKKDGADCAGVALVEEPFE